MASVWTRLDFFPPGDGGPFHARNISLAAPAIFSSHLRICLFVSSDHETLIARRAVLRVGFYSEDRLYAPSRLPEGCWFYVRLLWLCAVVPPKSHTRSCSVVFLRIRVPRSLYVALSYRGYISIFSSHELYVGSGDGAARSATRTLDSRLNDDSSVLLILAPRTLALAPCD